MEARQRHLSAFISKYRNCFPSNILINWKRFFHTKWTINIPFAFLSSGHASITRMDSLETRNGNLRKMQNDYSAALFGTGEHRPHGTEIRDLLQAVGQLLAFLKDGLDRL
jgi:hypothetical protein